MSRTEQGKDGMNKRQKKEDVNNMQADSDDKPLLFVGNEDEDGHTGQCAPSTSKILNTKQMNSTLSAVPPEWEDSPSISLNGGGIIRDSHQLLAIFPEEIWLLLSKQLTDPNDFENFVNASPYFRHLLLQERVLFLFPKVWDILVVKLESDADNDEQFDKYGVSKTDPGHPCDRCGRLRRKHCFSEILKLRVVSPHWCHAIDAFYDQDPDKKKNSKLERTLLLANEFLYPLPPPNALSNRLRRLYNLLAKTPQHVLQHFSQTRDGTVDQSQLPISNPFFGRECVIVILMNGDGVPQYFAAWLKLLEKYGHHIWCFSIHFPSNYQPPSVELYMTLRNLLHLMPNLRSFSIMSKLDHGGFEHRFEHLRETIILNPLPKLESLRFVSSYYLEPPVLHELLQKNNQVSHLDSVNDQELRERGFQGPELSTIRLPNLTFLNRTIIFEEEFDNLASPEVKFPLKSLKLEFCTQPLIRWPRIFSILENKWAGTLVDLEIKLPKLSENNEPNEVILRESLSYRLNLPKLKQLEVEMAHFACIDFILPMKNNLEFLAVNMGKHSKSPDRRTRRYKVVKNGQIIEFWGWTDRMLESNVWNICPKLERIDFDGKSFTRKEWEEKQSE